MNNCLKIPALHPPPPLINIFHLCCIFKNNCLLSLFQNTVISDNIQICRKIPPVGKNNKISYLPILTSLANKLVIEKVIMDLNNNYRLSAEHTIRLRKNYWKLKKHLCHSPFYCKNRGLLLRYVLTHVDL